VKDYQVIGLERIKILMRMCREYPDKAKRYTFLAKKISEKIGLPIPREFKRWICKECGEYLIPGRNATVRLKNKIRYVTCKSCGKIKRFQYS
jgi:ribonuclease P protein subunit RPR2